MLPPSMEFNQEIAEKKMTNITFAIGERSPSPDATIQLVRRLIYEIGLPGRLTEVNVPEDGLPVMA
jgi:alcohol dehydrogenase class IV